MGEGFVIRWINKSLTQREGINNKITEAISKQTNSHLLFLPDYSGWENDSQRAKFYKEARIAGFRPLKPKSRVWSRPLNPGEENK